MVSKKQPWHALEVKGSVVGYHTKTEKGQPVIAVLLEGIKEGALFQRTNGDIVVLVDPTRWQSDAERLVALFSSASGSIESGQDQFDGLHSFAG